MGGNLVAKMTADPAKCDPHAATRAGLLAPDVLI
jgi:hypothetical protein